LAGLPNGSGVSREAPAPFYEGLTGKFRGSTHHYSKRWKIEPYFRDLKDSRYGLGLEQTHIKSTERRDLLMLILALSYNLLSILGEAGEMIGFDKKLKVNTVKTRTHSLFRQGQFYYKFFVHFTAEEKNMLMMKFDELLSAHDFWGNSIF